MAGHNEHEEYQMLNAPVRLVDHPDYEAPRLKSTWLQMLPRMMCGCAILLAVVVPMVSVVWSVVSNAPGDPLHHHPGPSSRAAAIKQAALHAAAKKSKAAAPQRKGKSPWDFMMSVINSRPSQGS